MIAYLDSSVLLRALLNEEGKLKEFSKLERPISSKLLKTECLRALERLKLTKNISEDNYVKSIEQLYLGLDSIEFVEVSDQILNRAGGSISFPLGTLGAIHLISATYWRETTGIDLIFLTHDVLLGKAAKASGFHVLGC